MKKSEIFERVRTSTATVVVIILVAGSTASSIVYYFMHQSVQAKSYQALTQKTKQLETTLATRFSRYEEVLLGTKAFFVAQKGVVSREQWQQYVGSLSIESRYPGIKGVSYAERIVASQRATSEAAIQAEGVIGYSIHPLSTNPVSVAIKYVYPLNADTTSALGYDLLTDPVRSAALLTADATGQPTLSKSVVLYSDMNKPTAGEKGLILYTPIFPVWLDASADQAKYTPIGYSYVPVKIKTLFETILGKDIDKTLLFDMYEGDRVDPSKKLFGILGSTPTNISSQQRTYTIQLLNDTLTIVAASTNDLLTYTEREQPRLVFAAGIVSTMILTSFVAFTMRSRAQKIWFLRQNEVQRAKDDLLSLASHQLRTPATGVKQYLGVLIEGYSGPLKSGQKELAMKAYEANERQLEIVKQILHVARVETGRLELYKKNFSLNDLLKEVIDEQRNDAKIKMLKVQYKNPSRKIRMYGDERYVRMAFENLLSNAIKYTHAKGSVVISLNEEKARAKISFRDTGVGINKKDMVKLFQKFSRVDNPLSIEAGGSGIGLYLAKHIVEQHDGSIEVASDEKGSIFTIILPAILRKKKEL